MALDPTLAEAHAATGFLFHIQRNPEEALKHYRQAIQINPNYSIVYSWMGLLFSSQLGLYAEGFTATETAMRLDPLAIPALMNYISNLINTNRLSEADRKLEKLAAIAPGPHSSMRGIRMSLGGEWAIAILADLDGLRINPESGWSRDSLRKQFAMIGLEKESLAVSEATLPVVMRILGKPEDAVMAAQRRLANEPNSLIARGDLGLALAGTGDYARAWPILEEMWQRSGERVNRQGLFIAGDAAALIAIRRNAGAEAEVGKLLVALRDNVRRYHAAGFTKVDLKWHYSVDYEEGLAAYLDGERERGLALLAKAAEDGFFIWQKEAYLQALYDDPEFAPIRASQEARQARERKRFLDRVCTDNPYAAVWQPEEGTCEQFAAAAGN